MINVLNVNNVKPNNVYNMHQPETIVMCLLLFLLIFLSQGRTQNEDVYV